ncbi:adenylyl-sulfate kinase [Paenibacillus sp. CAU 1782]
MKHESGTSIDFISVAESRGQSGVENLGRGQTIWLTGLSGAGKSTIASALAETLRSKGVAVEWLDGDELRKRLGSELGFSRADRFENIARAVYLADMLNRHGVTVIVSLISPYREMRQYARQALPNFSEIYVDCPLEECERRDVKGLYAKARRGEITAFTGISDPYEPPEHPELVLQTAKQTVSECVNALLRLAHDPS